MSALEMDLGDERRYDVIVAARAHTTALFAAEVQSAFAGRFRPRFAGESRNDGTIILWKPMIPSRPRGPEKSPSKLDPIRRNPTPSLALLWQIISDRRIFGIELSRFRGSGGQVA